MLVFLIHSEAISFKSQPIEILPFVTLSKNTFDFLGTHQTRNKQNQMEKWNKNKK